MIICRCLTSQVKRWEGAAIRVLKGLDKRNRLCVKNIDMRGGGALPAIQESCIYITWRVVNERQIVLPKRKDINAIAYEAEGDKISAKQLKNTLDLITRPVQERDAIAWGDLL